ncbi:MAG TPA: RNA-binding S4 domain-containing protein [Actinomycetes bacterium]|nr:RNA-binding S4 domain-containing protein [Actinomycetes bacterium]
MPDVAIRDDMIRLGQFLKLANLVDTGADVKQLLETRAVRVNGEVETRRGRQLGVGDLVQVADQDFRVSKSSDGHPG